MCAALHVHCNLISSSRARFENPEHRSCCLVFACVLGLLDVISYLDNNLTGEIPKSLEALIQLKYFNVSFNRLSGEIPSGGPFANLTNESFMSNEALCGAPRLNWGCPMDRHRKSVVQVGTKSLELVDEGGGELLRFVLMVRGLGVRREVWISEIELIWLCLIPEDASSGFRMDFARSYGGFSRRLLVRRLVLKGGFVLRLEVRDNGRFWYVLIPELCGTGGWVDISRKFWEFCGWKSSEGSVDSRSFKEVAEIGGWPANTVAVKGKGRRCKGCDVEVIAESTQSFMTYLGRCLVGKKENEALGLPSAMEVQRWAQKSWKVSEGVQISDLGGVF